MIYVPMSEEPASTDLFHVRSAGELTWMSRRTTVPMPFTSKDYFDVRLRVGVFDNFDSLYNISHCHCGLPYSSNVAFSQVFHLIYRDQYSGTVLSVI